MHKKIFIYILLVVLLALPVTSFGQSSQIVNTKDSKYTYSDLKEDIKTLSKKYPDRLEYQVLGTTIDNRNLYCLKLGNPKSKKQIFVSAGLHAREYINSQVCMKLVEYYCRNYRTSTYKGLSYKELLDEVCFIIMPMVNPDGIAISALGINGIKDKSIRSKIRNMPRVGSYSNWSANARGVDLNRNYTMYSDWPEQTKPGSWGYPGATRFSENETKAVSKALKSCNNLKAVINYHSMGQVIYWGYHNKSYKEKCQTFLELFTTMTGYTPINESHTSKTYGDLEHYIMHTYKVPYVCIENGCGTIPVPNYEFNSIYKKNKNGFAKSAYMFFK